MLRLPDPTINVGYCCFLSFPLFYLWWIFGAFDEQPSKESAVIYLWVFQFNSCNMFSFCWSCIVKSTSIIYSLCLWKSFGYYLFLFLHLITCREYNIILETIFWILLTYICNLKINTKLELNSKYYLIKLKLFCYWALQP